MIFFIFYQNKNQMSDRSIFINFFYLCKFDIIDRIYSEETESD